MKAVLFRIHDLINLLQEKFSQAEIGRLLRKHIFLRRQRPKADGNIQPVAVNAVEPFEVLLNNLNTLRESVFRLILTIERFNFEKGETRGGGTAPPGPK